MNEVVQSGTVRVSPPPSQCEAILEAIREGLYTLDADWRVRHWNAAAERLLGRTREDVLGRIFHEAVPEPENAEVWAQLETAMRGRTAVEFDEIRHAQDRTMHLAVRAAPLPDGGLAVTLRDATSDRKLQQQYDRLLESIRDGFVAVDREWRIVFMNGAAEALLDLLREEAIGGDLRSIFPPGAPEIVEALSATMRDGTPRHLTAVRPRGRIFSGRFFDIWSYPLPTGGISILFEDVSTQVRRERDLARLAAEAEEANRAKSRFFAAVSHELRTPLNAIVGYTHLLSTGTYGPAPAGAQRAAERAGVCAAHLARLVDDVLLVTASEVGRLPVLPAQIDLEELLPTILEALRQQAEAKRLAFVVEVDPRARAVETDPERLRQLLQALVANAVKFTSVGEIRVSSRPVPDGVELLVADTGPGILPENRERIFEVFERVGDPSRSESMALGSGVGLAIARQLATLLRGRVVAEDRPGGGSVFRLTLPGRYGRGAGGGGG